MDHSYLHYRHMGGNFVQVGDVNDNLVVINVAAITLVTSRIDHALVIVNGGGSVAIPGDAEEIITELWSAIGCELAAEPAG